MTGAKSYGALPGAVRDYVERIEALLGVRITIVSLGPGREQTVRRG
nr:adenylosuccinate synthetase [Candidatus Methanocrinis natronophilus]